MVGGECIDNGFMCCMCVAKSSRGMVKGRRQVLFATSKAGTENESQRTNLETL